MSRTTLNFLLDSLLLFVFTAMMATAVVVRFVFPPGTQADHWTLWGHGYDAWVGLLFNLLALLAFGILVHVMLHWSWVCGVAASRLSKLKRRPIRIDDAAQTVYGVALLIFLLLSVGAFVAVATLQISSEAHTVVGVSPSVITGAPRQTIGFVEQVFAQRRNLVV